MARNSAPAATRDQAAATGGDPPAAKSRRSRIRSIDVMRGLMLALMLFTPPIRYGGTYPLLAHASWLGWTLTDVVFPLFLFTSGLSLAFLLRAPAGSKTRRRLARRLAALLALGVVYNGIGWPLRFSTLRFTGVLQLIGIAGAVAAAVVLISRRADGRDRHLVIGGVALGLVAAYGAVLLWSPGGCVRFAVDCSPFFSLDEAIFGRSHLYRPLAAITYDPEGLAVSVTAAALVLAGYLAARLLTTRGAQRTILWLMAAGTAGVGIALVLEGWVPISKRLLTPTFLLLTASLGAVVFAVIVALFDLTAKGRYGRSIEALRRSVALPFLTLGANALVVYLSERVLLQIVRQTSVDGQSTALWLLERAGTAPSAALVLSTLLLLTVLGIASIMRWRGWRIVL